MRSYVCGKVKVSSLFSRENCGGERPIGKLTEGGGGGGGGKKIHFLPFSQIAGSVGRRWKLRE